MMTPDFSTITYRGKRLNSNEWVYGYLIVRFERYFIATKDAIEFMRRSGVSTTLDLIEVDPETLGIHMLHNDIDDIPIYSGDILRVTTEGRSPYAEEFSVWVIFNESLSSLYATGECVVESDEFRFCRIIGNNHDNPELLEDVDFSDHGDDE